MKMISSVFHNAFKFTPSGRITLKASVDSSSRQIVFSIVDTGNGIPSNFLPSLFKPFTTEDESLTRHRDGLGLGLYVAKGIARKMGGDLWCERTATEGDNRGSEFRIRLPITPADASGSTPATSPPTPAAAAAAAAVAAAPPPPPPPTSPPPLAPILPTPSERAARSQRPRVSTPPTRSVVAAPLGQPRLSFDPELAKKLPLRILVVEDNRINRALLCSMLRRLGYRDIEEARDGVEAVEIFGAALRSSLSPGGSKKRAFNLVLMDLWMPRMDGFEAAERIVKMYKEQRRSKRKRPARLPLDGGDDDGDNDDGDDDGDGDGDGDGVDDGGMTVLAVSADATEEARAKAALKGIHGFVGKPFGIADLGKAMTDFRGGGVAAKDVDPKPPPSTPPR